MTTKLSLTAISLDFLEAGRVVVFQILVSKLKTSGGLTTNHPPPQKQQKHPSNHTQKHHQTNKTKQKILRPSSPPNPSQKKHTYSTKHSASSITALKFNSSALKNGGTGRRIEDDPFLLGFGNFSGAFAAKLQGGKNNLLTSNLLRCLDPPVFFLLAEKSLRCVDRPQATRTQFRKASV